jgi:hypothetical protein
MIFKQLMLQIPLPSLLKRLRGYGFLCLFYGDLVGYENLIKVCERENDGTTWRRY